MSAENNHKDRDPWSGRNKPQGPPDLETILRNFYQKLLFEMRRRAKQYSGQQRAPEFRWVGVGLIIFSIFFAWLIAGFYIVKPGEQAVITRFGKYLTTVGTGFHWVPRFIQSAIVVNQQKISSYEYDSQLLTKDENLVSVDVEVQYCINQAKDYLFNSVKPEQNLQCIAASTVQQVLGNMTLSAILTVDTEVLRQAIQTNLEKNTALNKFGLLVTRVSLPKIRVPSEVKDTFDELPKIQEEVDQLKKQAEATVLQANLNAKEQEQLLLSSAQAYKQQIVLHAKAETARFLALLPEYQRAPAVMRERLYLETLEQVFRNSTKVIVNANNNTLYFPLDKIIPPEDKVTPQTTANPVNANDQAIERKGGY